MTLESKIIKINKTTEAGTDTRYLHIGS